MKKIFRITIVLIALISLSGLIYINQNFKAIDEIKVSVERKQITNDGKFKLIFRKNNVESITQEVSQYTFDKAELNSTMIVREDVIDESYSKRFNLLLFLFIFSLVILLTVEFLIFANPF